MTQTRRDSSAWKAKHSKILAAALDEFIAKGFVGASMDQIAGRAKVSKVTIYNHFENKDVLYQQMIGYYLSQVHPGVPAIGKGGGAVRDVLVAHGVQLLEAMANPRTIGMIRLLRADPGQFQGGADVPTGGASESQLLPDGKALADYLSTVNGNDGLHIESPEIAARQYYGMLLENTIYPSLLGHDVDLSGPAIRKVVETCVDTLLCTCEPHAH